MRLIVFDCLGVLLFFSFAFFCLSSRVQAMGSLYLSCARSDSLWVIFWVIFSLFLCSFYLFSRDYRIRDDFLAPFTWSLIFENVRAGSWTSTAN